MAIRAAATSNEAFHYDYAVKKGADWIDIEHKIIAYLSGRSIEFPSEHNVGHLHQAKPVLADLYRSLDPTAEPGDWAPKKVGSKLAKDHQC